MRQFIKVSFISLGLLGAGLLSQGGYIQAKAQLAQVLIEHAWQQQLDTGKPVKPWPWADTHPLAKLTLANNDKPIMVLQGADMSTLAFGPGMVSSERQYPVPNKVIFGHKDTHFAALKNLKLGDDIRLVTADKQVLDYQVTERKVVSEDDTHLLVNPNQEVLSLVTCYPFNSQIIGGDKRYLVQATRVYPAVASIDLAELKRPSIRF
ncbi:class GN sortase [Paraferrimonas haliotis]|uniref:Class GN sortase n=1 Tax=Paraferrimonas haliotis TaxID=2013866 RepID=A0AA37TS79_9GAMM|nr:class GN sortase [Paraferrimonas haliotis]GLS84405.1 class GN sortase [Paraferrimonas haliotis]